MNALFKIWRGIVLLLLVAAILGPWVFDRILVPAQYTCQPPNIRLEGDFCGMPLSGLWMLSALAAEFVFRIIGLFNGSVLPSDMGRILLVFLVAVLLVLPLFTTLRLIVGRARRWQQGFAIAAWLLAVAAMAVYWILGGQKLYWALWGNLLYTGLAVCGLITEVASLALGRKPASN